MKRIVEDDAWEYLLVVDLEATCALGNIPVGEIEVIEIGAFIVQRSDYQIIDSFHSFVRPVIHPEITPFCTRLTHITQEDVQDAPLFRDVLTAIDTQLLKKYPAVFASWTDFDWKQLRRESLKKDAPFPFSSTSIDLQKKFKQKQQDKQLRSVRKALEHVGLEFAGVEHSAKADAYNTARLVPYSM